MEINKAILKNGFTYQELLKLKNQYRNKKNKTYGKKAKTTDDESFKNYILLIAELCGVNMILISPVFLLMIFGAYFYSNDVKQAIVYVILFIIFISFSIWNNSRGMKLTFLLTAKLIKLRLFMFLYRISPPKIKD